MVEVPPALDLGPGCKDPVNSAPHHAFVKAAIHALARWARDKVAPPQSPLIELSVPAAADPVVRDKFGNAKGGIRLPQVEAPTATLNGLANRPAQTSTSGMNFCFLFGTTLPFDKATLRELYPTHEAYVKLFHKAASALEKEGYWLKPEADQARHAAEQSGIGR